MPQRLQAGHHCQLELSFAGEKANQKLKTVVSMTKGEFNERSGIAGMAGRSLNTAFKTGTGKLGLITGGLITEKGIKEEMDRKKKEPARTE